MNMTGYNAERIISIASRDLEKGDWVTLCDPHVSVPYRFTTYACAYCGNEWEEDSYKCCSRCGAYPWAKKEVTNEEST